MRRCSAGNRSAGRNQADVIPGECDRSWTAAVGSPPLQKNASIFPSFNESADSEAPSPCRVTSASGSRPAARSTLKRDHLGAAAGRTRRHPLPAQIRDRS